MVNITKDNVIRFATVALYWFTLLLVFTMIEAFLGVMSGPLRSGEGLTFVMMMCLASLFLAGYSAFIPPVRHFLEAQFEHGDMKESIDKIQDSIKKVESEIDEIKQLINELAIQNDDEKNGTLIV